MHCQAVIVSNIRLTSSDLKPLDPGFPNTMSGPDPHVTGKAEGNPGAQLGWVDWLVDRPIYASHLNQTR